MNTSRSLVLFVVMASMAAVADRRAGAREPQYLPGDQVVTAVRTQLKVGDEIRTIVEPNTELTASAVEGEWLSVTVSSGGKQVSGWLFTRHARPSPKQLAALFNAGLRSLTRADFDRAIACDTAQARLEPDSGQHLVQRGIAQVGKGDLDKAIADFTAALECRDKPTAARVFRAWCLLARGEANKAVADCNEVLTAHPNAGEVLAVRGAAQLAQGKLDAAIADLNEVIRLKGGMTFSESLMFYPVRGRLLRVQLLLSLDGRSKQGFEFPNALVAEAYYHRGLAYAKKGDSQQALKDYAEATRIGLVPTDVFIACAEIHQGNGDKPKAAEQRLGAALYHLVRGEPAAAVAEFGRAEQLDPKRTEIHLWRGLAHWLLGDADKALGDYAAAAKGGGKTGSGLPLLRGLAHTSQGKTELAVSDFGDAASAEPQASIFYLLRGAVHCNEGRLD